MVVPLNHLDEMLTKAHDNAVAALLAAQARAIEAGAEIESEPVRRDPAGMVLRQGRLDLPSRGDLSITMDGRTLIQRVESRMMAPFDRVEARSQDGFSAVIAPFRWEDAEITFEARAGVPNWTPLRRWFLEWFQPKLTPLQPELGGVVHLIDGPHERGAHWQAYVDFGSASITAVADLIEATSSTGCTVMTIGQVG